MRPPENIYLQWYGEHEEDSCDDPKSLDDVSWHSEKVFPSDLEYVLVEKKEVPYVSD